MAEGFEMRPDPQKIFLRFIRQLSRLERSLHQAPAHVQNTAAHIIADLYRAFLREGVGQELSPLTRAITGEHPPLSTLADHVVVRETGEAGRGALVTFEAGWSKIAAALENGSFFIPTKEQRQALFRMAEDNSEHDLTQILGVDTGEGGSVWQVPPRPHIHFLNGSQLDSILRQIAAAVIQGTPVPNFGTSPVERGPFRAPEFVSIENREGGSFS